MKKYCKPFKRGVSWRSQNFGTNPNNGTNGPGGHTGCDDGAAAGTEIHAAGDGIIEYAGTFDDTWHDNLYWLINWGGNIMVLDCGRDEPTFIYGHLSRFIVPAGTRVTKGQVIALCGNSGARTTGSHCHTEAIPPGYTLHSPTLGRVNPDKYMTEWPDDITPPAKPLPEQDANNMLILAKRPNDTTVWIGDGITRRKIPNAETLNDLQWLAANGFGTFYKVAVVQTFENLEVLGIAL